MKRNDKAESSEAGDRGPGDLREVEQMLSDDPALARALGDFKRSVHAWSDAAGSRSRIPASATVRTWRKTLVWAMGCLLTVAAAGGGLVEHQHRRELARIAAEREAQRQVAEQRAQETEDLLAKVDRDVSREVPDAMEPLAGLMVDDNGQ